MSIANTVKKTIRYAQKNGFLAAYYTVLERVELKRQMSYNYKEPDENILEKQREYSFCSPKKISILVPAYETKPEFLNALINSVLSQTYSLWELIIADASDSKIVEDTVSSYQDDRICYRRLARNGGISDNTNQAMQYATGEYCALLDHDDLLTPDALYEMAKAIEEAENKGIHPAFLYSDEDKCDTEAKIYFDPHYKTDFDYELLLTNNYICHFLLIRTELLLKVGFRKEYDGAQDYDLVLRLVDCIQDSENIWKEQILHVPKMLYHWRCHINSTADNPESKMYAYEAGKRALESYYQKRNIGASVSHAMHLGFYQSTYSDFEQYFSSRNDVGVLGGLLVSKNHICGGAYDAQGKPCYQKMPQYFSGYMNRMHLTQESYAVDIRCMAIAPRWEKLYQKIVGIPFKNTMPTGNKSLHYGMIKEKQVIDSVFEQMSENEIRRKSIAFCEAVRKEGDAIVLHPLYRRELRKIR